jgi:hypothetical protein
MIDMRMRQNHRIQLLHRQRQMFIDLTRLLPVALKQSAIQQHILSRAFQMVR